MAALLSFEINPKWVAFSLIARSYFGFTISTQQTIPLSLLHYSQQGGKD